MARNSCNWFVNGKCARNLECDGHCPEYTKHKSYMTRGVSPIEYAYQRALKESQDLANRPIGDRRPDPDKRKYKYTLGENKCPKCGEEREGELTRLRVGWWLCRSCGWEGLSGERPKKMQDDEI